MDNKFIVIGVDGLIPELVTKFAEEGYLPNIKKMIDKGVYTKLLPYISTWGDVNWVSFITGNHPGNSWIGQSIQSSNKDNLVDISDQEDKKVALVHFPNTVLPKNSNHFIFAPFYGGEDDAPFELSDPTIYSTQVEKWYSIQGENIVKEQLGWPPENIVAHHKKKNVKNICNDNLNFKVSLKDGSEIDVQIQTGSEISLLMKDNKLKLEVNKWSEWKKIDFNDGQSGYVRYKLVHYCKDKGEIDLIQSQIVNLNKLSDNETLANKLIQDYGPFIQKWPVTASPDELYSDVAFEEGEYQLNWLAHAGLKLIKEGYDIFATVYRLVDETHHVSLGYYDPYSYFYTAEKAKIHEENMRKSYEILDKQIGEILDDKSENTSVILASDHGGVPNRYFCDIYLLLNKYGLCEIDSKGQCIKEKSKVFLKNQRGGLEIFINTKSNGGIVPDREYRNIQNEVYSILSGLQYNGENVFSVVLKKEEAKMVGYWGEYTGDIIFAYNVGFVWGTNRRDILGKVSEAGANHGPQSPVASTNHSSNYGVFIGSGKVFKDGYHHQENEGTPYFMSDVGKTLGYLINLKNHKKLDGKLMNELLKN